MQDYYTQYYFNQSGGGGGGSTINNLNDHFLKLQLPRVYQRGRGVGAIFSSIWRFLKPLLKSGASFVGREAVETGADILKGISNQKPLNQIITDRSLTVVDKIRDNVANKIKSMSGSGFRLKRKLKNKKAIKSSVAKKNPQFDVLRRPSVTKKRKTRNKLNNKKTIKRVKSRIIDIFSN